MATLGPYRLLRPLGEGGMGEVHLAERNGRRVALKLIAGPAPSEALLERFEAEAKVRVNHPNVVEVLDAGTLEGRAFIALELLEGETLRARFHRGPVPSDALAALGAQMLDGLQAVHEAGVVHRDLKPSNVFVTRDGTAKLIDFGVALVENATRLTRPDAVPGTMGYLSPEQAAGHEATRRSDLWAVAAVLYEGLSGRPPFLKPTALATALATLLEVPPALSERVPDAPSWLVQAIERGLSRDPHARFSSAADFAQALRGGELVPEDARPTLASGERRVVAVWLAEGVRDAEGVAALVHDAGGTVCSLAGHRVLALFGAARSHGGELERAAQAALDARPLATWVALASGWASSRDGTLEGDAIVAVERAISEPLEGVAVDSETAAALPGRFALRPAGEGVFELLREGAPAEDRVLPLVGRDAERAQLRAALGTAQHDRRGVLVTLVGPPGIGKSRLLADVAEAATQDGARVLEGSATPRAKHEDLGWMRSLLRRTAPDEYERLTRWAEGDLRLQRDRMHRALADWLLAEVERHPVVLLLDDAHASDAASLDLLDEVLDDAEGALCVVAASPQEGVFADRAPVVVAPRPLDRIAIAALSEAVTGTPLPASAVSELAERTGGNPLFVVHCAAAGAAGKRPRTVEAAVQIQLDALSEADRLLCRAAAVFHRPFGVAELGAFEGVEADRLLPLVRRSLFVRRGRRRDARYTFANALIGEVAYESSTVAKREALHLRVAQLARDPAEQAFHLERAGRLERAAEAHGHAARAAARRGDCSAALHASERALALGVEQPFELHMVQADALRFLGRRHEQRAALDAASCSPSTPEGRARMWSELAVWHWRGGDPSEALAAADRALRAADETDDPEARMWAYGRRFLVMGAGHEAAPMLAEAMAQGPRLGAGLRATLLAWEAHHHATVGDIGKQLGAYAELVEAYDGLGDLRRKAGAEANLADTYNRLGAHADAAEALGGALEACRRVRNRTLEGYALLNLGYAHFGMGEHEAGMRALADAAQLAEELGEVALAAWVQLYRARALDPKPAWETASALLNQPLEGLDAIRAGASAVAARAALKLGRLDEAQRHSTEAMALLRQLGSIQEGEPYLYRARIAVLRAAGDVDAADALARELDTRLKAQAAGIEDEVLRGQFLATAAERSVSDR